jgi:hypothetical protein
MLKLETSGGQDIQQILRMGKKGFAELRRFAASNRHTTK